MTEVRVRQFPDLGRSDHFSVDARSRTPNVHDVHVVPQVMDGLIVELELFAGEVSPGTRS